MFHSHPDNQPQSHLRHDYLPPGKQLRARSSASSLHHTPGNSYKAQRDKASPFHQASITSKAPLLQRMRQRPKLLSGLALLILAGWLAAYLLADLIVLARFKLRDRAYEEGWVRGCGMRKKPLLFVRGTGEVALVWEMNCEMRLEVRWGAQEVLPRPRWWRVGEKVVVDRREEAKVHRIKVDDLTDTHYVYQAVLQDLRGGTTYAYTICHPSPSKRTPLASHAFRWLGPSPSTSSPTTIHLAALADNQYNLRTFHRILLTLIAYGRSLPSSPPPSLLLHAGDNVQNPHNLAQWQTDFWDPLTSLLPFPLGPTTPVLLARGNHDWDETGLNAYTGGSPPREDWLAHRRGRWRDRHPGTYMSYSPHARCRILVLDANLGEEEQGEQEAWLEWELGRREWTDASLRIVVVHVPPFLEFWDRTAWTDGGESEWSSFVRHRLTPLLSLHGTSLVLSGHQHAYSRGFLPADLHRAYTSSPNSSAVPPFALAAAAERGWEKTAEAEAEVGTVYAIIGGAGGTLDEDRVEEWGFYKRSVAGVYHFVWITMEFGVDKAEGSGRGGKVEGGKRVYKVGRAVSCLGKEVVDTLEWTAVGLDGKVLDAFRVEAAGCLVP